MSLFYVVGIFCRSGIHVEMGHSSSCISSIMVYFFFFCEHSQILTSSLFTLFYCFQDILRLLTLWFNHGATAEVQMALHKGFSYVNIDTWLVVLPQIIARIHSNNHAVRELIQSLLVRIGESHPQVCLRLFLCFFIIF